MSDTTKYYVDTQGKYLGAFDGYQPADEPVYELMPVKGADGEYTGDNLDVLVGYNTPPFVMPAIPEGAIEVATPPAHGLDTWDGTAWVPHPPEPKPLTVESLAAVLKEKGVLTDSDISNAKEAP